jgi:hypothetical protein
MALLPQVNPIASYLKTAPSRSRSPMLERTASPNNAMQLTRGGWRRVVPSSLARTS